MKEIRRNSLQARKEVFESAGVPDVPKSTGCRTLRRSGKCGKPEVRPPLKNIHKRKRMEWEKNNMKLNFQTFCSLMSVARPSMDPMDGGDDASATRVHVLTRSSSSKGVAVMFWAAIVDNELVEQFSLRWRQNDFQTVYWLPEGPPCPVVKKKSLSFLKDIVFMHDNAPSHAARLTTEYLASVFARHEKSYNGQPALQIWILRKILKASWRGKFVPVEGSTPPRTPFGKVFWLVQRYFTDEIERYLQWTEGFFL